MPSKQPPAREDTVDLPDHLFFRQVLIPSDLESSYRQVEIATQSALQISSKTLPGSEDGRRNQSHPNLGAYC